MSETPVRRSRADAEAPLDHRYRHAAVECHGRVRLSHDPDAERVVHGSGHTRAARVLLRLSVLGRRVLGDRRLGWRAWLHPSSAEEEPSRLAEPAVRGIPNGLNELPRNLEQRRKSPVGIPAVHYMHSGHFGTVQSDALRRQGRQIVQSWMNLDDFLP